MMGTWGINLILEATPELSRQLFLHWDDALPKDLDDMG